MSSAVIDSLILQAVVDPRPRLTTLSRRSGLTAEECARNRIRRERCATCLRMKVCYKAKRAPYKLTPPCHRNNQTEIHEIAGKLSRRTGDPADIVRALRSLDEPRVNDEASVDSVFEPPSATTPRPGDPMHTVVETASSHPRTI